MIMIINLYSVQVDTSRWESNYEAFLKTDLTQNMISDFRCNGFVSNVQAQTFPGSLQSTETQVWSMRSLRELAESLKVSALTLILWHTCLYISNIQTNHIIF